MLDINPTVWYYNNEVRQDLDKTLPKGDRKIWQRKSII